jgi:hypothetical protein
MAVATNTPAIMAATPAIDLGVRNQKKHSSHAAIVMLTSTHQY